MIKGLPALPVLARQSPSGLVSPHLVQVRYNAGTRNCLPARAPAASGQAPWPPATRPETQPAIPRPAGHPPPPTRSGPPGPPRSCRRTTAGTHPSTAKRISTDPREDTRSAKRRQSSPQARVRPGSGQSPLDPRAPALGMEGRVERCSLLEKVVAEGEDLRENARGSGWRQGCGFRLPDLAGGECWTRLEDDRNEDRADSRLRIGVFRPGTMRQPMAEIPKTVKQLAGLLRQGEIAMRGRRYWKSDRPLNPVLILTGTELFADYGHPPYCWSEELRQRFQHIFGLLDVCDATQQVYLGLPSWHDTWRKAWGKRHAKRSQEGSKAASMPSPRV